MRKWHAAVCAILIWLMPTPTTTFRALEMNLLPPAPTLKTVAPKEDLARVSAPKVSVPKVMPNSISDFYGQVQEKIKGPPIVTTVATTTMVSMKTVDDVKFRKKTTIRRKSSRPYADDLKPPDAGLKPKPRPKVKTGEAQSKMRPAAGVPENLTVSARPLDKSYHELQLNVSWLPPSGVPAQGYTVEVTNVTKTDDCLTPICYRQGINTTWVLFPEFWTSIPGGCAIRPGCAYLIKVNADPWDGFTIANLTKEFKECEAGVCSCAYSPRLPSPVVSAVPVTIKNKLYSNVSWYLPTPKEPQRLPSGLDKKSYIITLHKQKTALTNRTIFEKLQNPTVEIKISGLVFEGDSPRWETVLISPEMADKKKLMVKIELVDSRDCVGYPGTATVFDPAKIEKLPTSTSKLSLGIYAILGALIGAWPMGAVFVLSARVVKRVLKSFRPAPVSAPLEPLRRRPAWFPLQLRT